MSIYLAGQHPDYQPPPELALAQPTGKPCKRCGKPVKRGNGQNRRIYCLPCSNEVHREWGLKRTQRQRASRSEKADPAPKPSSEKRERAAHGTLLRARLGHDGDGSAPAAGDVDEAGADVAEAPRCGLAGLVEPNVAQPEARREAQADAGDGGDGGAHGDLHALHSASMTPS